MIESQAITVRLGGRTILSDVDFVARPGEITVIAGPNGSGKSTLVKALSGEIGAFGRILVNARRIDDYGTEELALWRGVLAQSTTMAFPFTVSELLDMGLAAGNAAHRDAPAVIRRRALDLADIARLEGRAVMRLSGGEQQRAHLARVLCQISTPDHQGRPRWLLLDEPVSSLDIRHQWMVMAAARQFADQGGGVIAVLHDLTLAAACADRVWLMKEGRVAACGASGEVIVPARLSDVFGLELAVHRLEAVAHPVILPVR